MLGAPRPIQHPVKFYERGERPLEIVASRQWYIRNGGRSKDLQQELIQRGREMAWHPSYMRHRYENWVEGLNGDWLVSRQRFFGVPVPVWYALDAEGEPDYDHPLLPSEDDLPIDPSIDVPAGYTADQRNRPNGFAGDPDIFDTWATSSLTPEIAACWEEAGSDLFDRVFPMDMRPQSHEIIRTWLFATVVRSHYEFDTPRHGRTARSPGGSSTLTARRCRSRRATSSRRWICSTRTAPTPCATGVRPPVPARIPPSARIR